MVSIERLLIKEDGTIVVEYHHGGYFRRQEARIPGSIYPIKLEEWATVCDFRNQGVRIKRYKLKHK